MIISTCSLEELHILKQMREEQRIIEMEHREEQRKIEMGKREEQRKVEMEQKIQIKVTDESNESGETIIDTIHCNVAGV